MTSCARFADLFWAKWLKCYILMLKSRQKLYERTPSLNPCDNVLIANGSCVRGLLPKAEA